MERKTQTQVVKAPQGKESHHPNILFLSTLTTEFTAKYETECLIGWGGFGTVAKVRRKNMVDSNGSLACKFIPKSKMSKLNLEIGTNIPSEVIFLKRLSHPNIVSLHDFFQDQTFYYIITDFHGEVGNLAAMHTQRKAMDLFEYTEINEFLSESHARKIFTQIMSAVSYMHSEGIVHGDIKDENILIDCNGIIKLIDFGSASYFGKKKFNRFLGTIQYASPEILRGEYFDGPGADVWALGCCLYTMLTGQIPFRSKRHALNTSFYPPIRPLTPSCTNLLLNMLQKDPRMRCSVLDIVNHEWLIQK